MKRATARARYPLLIPVLSAWVLSLVVVSLPGRVGPESAGDLDAIAVAKLASRLLVATALGLLFLFWPDPERRRRIVLAMAPLIAFVIWATLSTLWSPLRSVSLGQAFSLFTLTLLAGAIGLTWDRNERISGLLANLSWALLLLNIGLLLAHLYDPLLSGLHRETEQIVGGRGLIHPTSAGASASLGLVVLLVCVLQWGWRWARVLFLPGLLVHGTVLLLAASRASIACTVIVSVLAIFVLSRGYTVALLVLLVSLLGAGYLALDPDLAVVAATSDSTATFLARGQSVQSIQAVSGRAELWEAVWNEFARSPLVGHGYFVTSRAGSLDLWNGPANYTAHNVFLQVLVSTGLVGAMLLCWGLVRPTRLALAHALPRPVARLLGLMAVWYFVWGLFSAAFMGPIQPDTVFFFCCVGIIVGHVVNRPMDNALAAPLRGDFAPGTVS